jgi:choloylglycine hydrolase
LSLSPENPASIDIGGTTFAAFAQGQGFRGLPGDGTSPSRFIRVLTAVRFAAVPADRDAAELGTIRTLHGFDIVAGDIEEPGAHGEVPELTMWSTVSDLTANRYLVNVYADPQWFAVDLTTTDFSTSRVSALPSAGGIAALTL